MTAPKLIANPIAKGKDSSIRIVEIINISVAIAKFESPGYARTRERGSNTINVTCHS